MGGKSSPKSSAISGPSDIVSVHSITVKCVRQLSVRRFVTLEMSRSPRRALCVPSRLTFDFIICLFPRFTFCNNRADRFAFAIRAGGFVCVRCYSVRAGRRAGSRLTAGHRRNSFLDERLEVILF